MTRLFGGRLFRFAFGFRFRGGAFGGRSFAFRSRRFLFGRGLFFLDLGRRLGPRVRDLFQLFPAHLVPWIALGLILLSIGYLGYEHGFKPKDNRKSVQEPH